MNEGINKLFQRDNSTPTIEKFEVDLNELKEFLNIYDDADDTLLKSLTLAGKQYIKDYTGLTEEEMIEKKESLKIALFLIVSDLYDNRGQQSLQNKRNTMLTSILDMYCKNYLH